MKTKLQYHKIPNVDKSICTAEAKIAYNMAFRIGLGKHRGWGDIPKWEGSPRFVQFEWEAAQIEFELNSWKRTEPNSRYNVDAIQSCLRAGLHEYLTRGCPVFSDYEDVGKCFKSLYL